MNDILESIKEYWTWDNYAYQNISEYPIAKKGNEIVIIASSRSIIYLEHRSKNNRYLYNIFGFKLHVRAVWELECAKSYLINQGYTMIWDNYQAILYMYTQRFKLYCPYLGK